MLSVPTKSFRVKAAIALAALYALCILAPAAAFAFSDNPKSPKLVPPARMQSFKSCHRNRVMRVVESSRQMDLWSRRIR